MTNPQKIEDSTLELTNILRDYFGSKYGADGADTMIVGYLAGFIGAIAAENPGAIDRIQESIDWRINYYNEKKVVA